MYILAIETTGAAASAALINEEGIVTFQESAERLNHLQTLMIMTEKLLRESKLSIGDITCIAVSEGPGSFTGIRIGVSTARALGQALNLETISVPTLKAFAYNLEGYKGIVCPLFDARRDQVYAGAYQWNEKTTEVLEIVKGDAILIQELFEKLEKVASGQEILFFGDGIKAYESQISRWTEMMNGKGVKVVLAAENIRFQKASSVARLGLELWNQNKTTDFEGLKPVYMRKPEAQRKLEEGSLKNV